MTQDLGRGLQQLLDFEGDVESVYARQFVVCFLYSLGRPHISRL
jgi:hypothetical protein